MLEALTPPGGISSSAFLYCLLVLAVALERVGEMILTRRNARRMMARGGRPVGDEHFPWMLLLHVGLLVAAPLEAVWAGREFVPWLGWPALALVAATMSLRYWAITTLGDRWTTRIFVVPGEPPVTGGPYRFLRHPNYLAVIVEVAALPLVHTAWVTALAGSIGNFFMLRTRIRVEEKALSEAASYYEPLEGRAALIPSLEDAP